MYRISLMFLLVVLFVVSNIGCASKNKPEQPKPAATPEKQLSKEEMEAKWRDYATPGAEHKKLNSMVGKWNYIVKFWMDPTIPPETSSGKTEMKWVMGGRFLEHSATGKSMGMPFHGSGVVGFDKSRKRYQTIWYDDMGTGIMIGSGKFDDAKQQLIEYGKVSCPIRGELSYKGVTTLIDKNNMRHEMFSKLPGSDKDTKVMDIQYTRR